MLTPLLATLVLLSQAPIAPEEPITVLIAPADSAGVPEHIVEFAQEHVTDQARSKGLTVLRMKDILRKLPASRRRALLRCKRTELRCLTSLGQAAKSEVVLVAELLRRQDGFRVGTKLYDSKDGGLVAEHLIPGVKENAILDALTQSLEVVVPRMKATLRPGSVPPPPEETKPPPEETKPPVVETTPEVKPETTPEVKPPEVKPDVKPIVEQRPAKASRSWAWVPAAGGAVAAGAGTYFLLQAKSEHDKLKNATPGTPLLNAEQVAKDGKRHQLLSRIGFGLGVAGVATSAVLYLLPGDDAPVKPSVAVGPGGGMVGVVGTLP